MKRLFLFPFLMLLSISATSQEIYVSPRGRDDGQGTREKPFKTLDRARDEVQKIKRRSTGEITVWLLGGRYELLRSFELGSADGGSPSSRVTYAAAPGHTVRISGGREIPAHAIKKISGTNALRRLPSSSLSHVRQVDLKSLGVEDFGRHRQFGHGLPVVPAPIEVFWNDSAMQLARYPNEGAILMGEVLDPGSVPRVGDYSDRPGRFRYTDPRHSRWAGIGDVWFQGFFKYGFADDKIRVASIDTLSREVRLASPHLYGLGSGENFNQYIALNLLEELDEPGEWYVDPVSGLLYLWPPEDKAEGSLTVSILEEPLIVLDHCSYIHLRGFIIECGRGIGVYAEGGQQNRIDNCEIRNFGTVGIMTGQGARPTQSGTRTDDFEGAPVSRDVGSFNSYYYVNTVWERDAGTDHTISGCEVYGTGSGGIILGGGSKRNLTPGRNTVTDCRIHDFNRRNRAGAPGIMVDGCGNIVSHNEIYNGDLQAIFVRGNDHLFEYNLIHHVARNSNDASAWYLGRDPSDRGCIIRWNFFHHVGRPDRKWTMGVYFDDATCDALVEGNIFYRVASYGTVYSNGGHDLVVQNNIFIEGYGPAYQLKSMWYDFGIEEIPYYFGEKGIYTRRLTKSIDLRRPPYSERYPLLKDWLDFLPDGETYVGMRPRRNVFERNVLVRYEETFRLVGKYAQTDFGENYITQDDPGFVDAARMNFALKENSEVYAKLPGFEAIPFARIGPRQR